MMIISVLMGALAVMNSATTPTPKDSSPIAIEETGVATEYEATKTIRCGNVEWHVDWKSAAISGPISGAAKVVIDGKSKPLPDIQKNILNRFSTIDSVSATCNGSADGKLVRTSLLILGIERGTGKKSLAQVRVEPGSGMKWTFDAAE